MLCTQRVVLQMLATEALTTEGEDGGGIKEAVERAEQRVVLAEDFPPVGGILVAPSEQSSASFSPKISRQSEGFLLLVKIMLNAPSLL